MSHISFFVPGKPVGYDRSAARLMHTPKDVTEWRQAVQTSYRQAAPATWPREGEYVQRVGVEVDAYGSHSDLDNLAKEVMDALKGHAYRDDAQVVELGASAVNPVLTKTGQRHRHKAGEEQGLLVTLSLYDLPEVA
jgi:Holliday junction resolvase RusA-like endonuclease